MTDSRGCEHEGTKMETASNRLNGVADPEGATLPLLISRFLIYLSLAIGASLLTMCNKTNTTDVYEKRIKNNKKIQK